MYGEQERLTAPLASIEDLSRVNTPGGSPSPRPKHPALSDPNWEPPEETVLISTLGHPAELAPLQPKKKESQQESPEGGEEEGPVDR